MDHSIVNYLNDKLTPHVQSLSIVIDSLGQKVDGAGGGVKLALNNLSIKIQESSDASNIQAKRMYILTWVLAGSAVLNVAAIVWQTYH